MQEQKRFEFPLINPNSLFCKAQHSAIQVCTTHDCKSYAFICQKPDCECIKSHVNCITDKLINILQKMQKQRKVISPKQQQIIENIREQYDKLLDTISKSRQQFQQLIDNFGVCAPAHQLVKKIIKGDLQSIDGQHFYQLKTELQIAEISVNYGQVFLDAEFKVKHKFAYLWEKYNSLFLDIKGIKTAQQNLKELTCKNVQFTQQKLRQISKISLLSKQYTKIPRQMRFLINLDELCLGNCQIQKIQHIRNLKKLKILNLAGNKIKKIENIQNLGCLQQLFLQSNLIEKIQNLQTLSNLIEINLGNKSQNQGNNKIKKLQNLKMLKKLNQVRLYDNKIGLTSEQQLEQLFTLHQQGTKIYLANYIQEYHVQNEKNSPNFTETLKNKFLKWLS